MKKGNVTSTQGGFSVTPTKEYTDKQAREQRIADRKANPKATYTEKDVMEYLNDLADRQSEIYDLLKAK
jgi:hypothetical protein